MAGSQRSNLDWESSAASYRQLIKDPGWDSRFLRRTGLIPNTLDLIGNCDESVLLDAGTGSGWLFDHIQPANAYACDIVVPDKLPDWVLFDRQDVQSLTYANNKFDLIVSSLVLIFCERLDDACRSLYRVAKPNGGRLILSIMNPYFYRTGYVDEFGNFVVARDLQHSFQQDVKIGEKVGPLVYYYRPLPEYLNALISAGWEIKKMKDWYIDMDEYNKEIARGLKTKINRIGTVPLYTFIECEKR